MPEPSTERAYFPELDGLRMLAFLLVFGFHGGLPWVGELVSLVTLPLFVVCQWMGPGVTGWAADLGPACSRALRTNGWVGVQLFFILSGYLIATLLLREERRWGRVDLRAFWARRILRIWPLYYLTVALAFVVLPVLDGRARGAGHWAMVRVHLPWFLGFLGNWSMIRNGPVGDDAISILWSVCVEEQFYILCPLLIVWVARGWRLAAVVALMLGSVAARGWLASGHPPQLVVQYNTFAQLDTMLAGVALALVLDAHPAGDRAARWAGVWGWLVPVAAAWLLTTPALAHVKPWRQTWDFVAVWACGLAVVALPVIRPGGLRRWLATGWMVWLGRISFGLYMYHEVALGAARGLLIGLTTWETPVSLLALGLTVGVASTSYYGYERPFLRLKQAWARVPSRPV